MIVMDAEFPATCRDCPVRAVIGCDLSFTKKGLLDTGIHPDCPFESAEPVNNTGAALVEFICLWCLHRWTGIKPKGILLKNMECPECKKKNFTIETGEDTLAL